MQTECMNGTMMPRTMRITPDQESVVSAGVCVCENGVECMAEGEETEQCNVQARYVEVAKRNSIKDLERHDVCF